MENVSGKESQTGGGGRDGLKPGARHKTGLVGEGESQPYPSPTWSGDT